MAEQDGGAIGMATRSYQGVTIQRRCSDGYFNATSMCKCFQKLFADYMRSQRASQYLDALASSLVMAGSPPATRDASGGHEAHLEAIRDSLVHVKNGGNHRGSWIHERVAVDLARWLSPNFAVYMDAWVLEAWGLSSTSHQQEDTLLVARPCIGKCDAVKIQEEVSEQVQQAACAPSQPPMTLLEVCLDWIKDLGVSRHELPGVKAQFKALVHVEVSSGALPQKPPTEAWAKAPPVRFRDLAEAAAASYRALLERRFETMSVGDASKRTGAKRKRSDGQSSEESDEETNILKISEVMRVAGVWRGVWPVFRSDLANQMLSLKCADTEGAFSARRCETVRGSLPVLVHKYKKSADWPLAWKALENTRDLYEKRIRECLEEAFSALGESSGVSGPTSAQLAKGLAAKLNVSGPA